MAKLKELREYLRRQIIKHENQKFFDILESVQEKQDPPSKQGVWKDCYNPGSTDIFKDLKGNSQDPKILEILSTSKNPDPDRLGLRLTFGDRFIGIPKVGTLEMGDHAYESSIDKRDILADTLVEEYLPEAKNTHSNIGLPSFSIEGHDIGVEENWQGAGPTWSPQEVPYTFVLVVETRESSNRILYGEDPSFLIWAGINYVYANYDLDKFYDEFFGALTL